MTRYFLNVRSPTAIVIDDEGDEFVTLEAARDAAEASARELLADMISSGKRVSIEAVEICDIHGKTVERVPFAALLDGRQIPE